jgi:hypothetical protein
VASRFSHSVGGRVEGHLLVLLGVVGGKINFSYVVGSPWERHFLILLGVAGHFSQIVGNW